MWEAFARNPENASEWQNSYMDLMFDIIDTSGIKPATCTYLYIYLT